jgi:hypothetical protein
MKGKSTKTINLKSALNAEACGFDFVLGNSYLVYTNLKGGDHRVSTCSRTKLLDKADEEIKELDALSIRRTIRR